MKEIKDLSDKELKQTYKGLYEDIYILECYGLKDLMYLGQAEKELEKRGIEISIQEKVIFN